MISKITNIIQFYPPPKFIYFINGRDLALKNKNSLTTVFTYLKVTGCLSVFVEESRSPLSRYSSPLQESFSLVNKRLFKTNLEEGINTLPK